MVLFRLGGPLKSKMFISDLAPAYWRAWQQVMGPDAAPDDIRTFCNWHTMRAFISNLRVGDNKIEDEKLRKQVALAIQQIFA